MPIPWFWWLFCDFVEKCSARVKESLTCSEILGHENSNLYFNGTGEGTHTWNFVLPEVELCIQEPYEISPNSTWESVSFSSSCALTLNKVSSRSSLTFYVGLFCSWYGKSVRNTIFYFKRLISHFLKAARVCNLVFLVSI